MVACWPGHTCAQAGLHPAAAAAEAEYYEFRDSCPRSGPCFVASQQRFRCDLGSPGSRGEVRLGAEARGEVIGFDGNDKKVVKQRNTVQVTDRERNFGQAQGPRLTLGLRRVAIREDYTKYPGRGQAEDRLVYSDYDDTDLNPNILVNYLNRKHAQAKAPTKKSSLKKSVKKVEDSYLNRSNSNSVAQRINEDVYNDIEGVNTEDTIENEYRLHTLKINKYTVTMPTSSVTTGSLSSSPTTALENTTTTIHVAFLRACKRPFGVPRD